MCKGDCRLNVCGDGYLAATESCDDGNDNPEDGCDQCMLASCGDGKVGPGEECDLGGANGGAECSKLCKLPFCGDGMAGPGEDCDEGVMNSDVGKCTLKCKAAACGDGLVWAGLEQCDDGNNVQGDGCEGCMTVVCGDGVIMGSEECDDGNDQVDDTCNASCKRVAYYIFATSQSFNGNLGGLDGADTKCTEAAASAKLPGKYKAWLSGDKISAESRLEHSAVPYVLPSMKVVAVDWGDLVDGILTHAIDVNELKMAIFGVGGNCAKEALVWTGTATGGGGTGSNCSDWQSSQNQATAGNLHEIDKDWTQTCLFSCSNPGRLYCVEQP